MMFEDKKYLDIQKISRYYPRKILILVISVRRLISQSLFIQYWFFFYQKYRLRHFVVQFKNDCAD